MTTRRHILAPLALLPVAAWAVWASGTVEAPNHASGPFHLPLDDSTALWRDLAQVRLGGPTGSPQFPDRVSALNGQSVAVRGFMLPLEDGTAHKRFILSANPVSCPACQRPSPASMIQVHSLAPLPETAEPVLLTGSLRLRPQDGLFYRLERAAVRLA